VTLIIVNLILSAVLLNVHGSFM